MNKENQDTSNAKKDSEDVSKRIEEEAIPSDQSHKDSTTRSQLISIAFFFGFIIFALLVYNQPNQKKRSKSKTYSSSSKSVENVSYAEAKSFIRNRCNNIGQRLIDSTPYHTGNNKEYLFLTSKQGIYCLMSVNIFTLSVATVDCGGNAYEDFYGYKKLAKSLYGY